jgi:glycosyltransferase involved in cell wall biosynthesis
VKVIWVTPQQPGPSGGGGSHHEFELLRALAARHDIEVISSYHAAEVGGLDIPVEIVGFDTRRPPQSRLQTALALTRARQPLHSWVLGGRIDALRAAIRRRGSVDHVHVMMGEIAPVLDVVPGSSSLLLFDSYTRHAEALLGLEHIPRRRLRWRIERGLARSFERRWYPLATALATVSPDDADTLRDLLDRPVEVIPNPIGPELFAAPERPRSTDTVLFVGSMGYPPNVEALEWWAASIWPQVQSRRPEARFLAVGRANDAPHHVDRLRALFGDALVLDVPDIRPYYWEAAVCVAPVRLGAGLRNKVIHAMACGAPVVATSAAAEGTGAEGGAHLLLADDAPSFASAVVECLEHPGRAADRAVRARELVDDLRTDRIAAHMERWWDEARGRREAVL